MKILLFCIFRVPFSRSLSDGNIISDASSAIDIGQRNGESEHSYRGAKDSRNGLSESSPEISTFESDSSYPRFALILTLKVLWINKLSSFICQKWRQLWVKVVSFGFEGRNLCRFMPAMPRRQLFLDTHAEDYPHSNHIFYNKRLDSFNCSNFLDVDWISSSVNSCEGEPYERW